MHTARSFAQAEDGNLAVIFASVLIPALTFVGAAIGDDSAVKARTLRQQLHQTDVSDSVGQSGREIGRPQIGNKKPG
jgi:hypothetical protein